MEILMGLYKQAPKSDNVYLKLLVKLYRFLARTSPPTSPPQATKC